MNYVKNGGVFIVKTGLKNENIQYCPEVYKSYMKEYKRIKRFDLIDKN